MREFNIKKYISQEGLAPECGYYPKQDSMAEERKCVWGSELGLNCDVVLGIECNTLDNKTQ